MNVIKELIKKSSFLTKIIKKLLLIFQNNLDQNTSGKIINKYTDKSVKKQFPDEFDDIIYSHYEDLKSINKNILYNHYINHGEKEGRISNAIPDRFSFLKLINIDKKILEIGPFTTPSIIGKNVKYFDLMDIKELKLRAKRHNHHIGDITKIDYVSSDGNLNVIKDKFDYVLSSHCLEHQPDLILHFKNVEKLLKKQGYYFLIIPDKRYCFDALLPESSISKIIENHIEKRKIHTPSSILEHRALTTHNDPIRHWSGDHEDNDNNIVERLNYAIKEIKNNPNKYIDVHSLQFTPKSFCNILEILYSLRYTKLRIERCYPTVLNSNEFFVILKN
jgi:SAM-dependent methyltransferase